MNEFKSIKIQIEDQYDQIHQKIFKDQTYYFVREQILLRQGIWIPWIKNHLWEKMYEELNLFGPIIK